MNFPQINIGAFLDDPTAERVRDAFEKVNDWGAFVQTVLNPGTKIQEIFRGFTSGSGTLAAQAAASINAGAAFTILPNRLGVVTFVSGDSSVDEPTTTDYGYTKHSFIIETGAGTYGSGGTTLTGANLIELAPVSVDIDASQIFALGDIGTAEIEDFVNGSGPYVVTGLAVFTATQNGDDKVWLFTGGSGTFGDGAQQTDADMFVDLTAQDPIPVPTVNYLPKKVITTTPYSITADDLNRPLIFTSNNQVVNVSGSLVSEALSDGLTLFDFKAHFTGTGTHTVNYPDSESDTFSQDALIYALCIDTTGDTVWVVKEWYNREEHGVGTLHNTVIGGVGVTINTKALLAAQLTGVDAGDISNFYLVGNDVFAQINKDYTGIGASIRENASLTSYQDPEGRLLQLSANTNQFRQTTLTKLVFNGITTITTDNVGNGATALTHFEARNLLSIAGNSFLLNAPLSEALILPMLRSISGLHILTDNVCTNFNFENLRSITAGVGSPTLAGLLSSANFYAPNLKSLVSESTTLVFSGITTGTITVHSDLATANAGQEHAALAARRAAGATIVYHQTVPVGATTGVEIRFRTPQIYNSPASPATGNITNVLTGANIGVVQKIYHNHSTAPTVPAGWVLMGEGAYVEDELNIIFAEWVSGTRVEYWIVQEA